MGKYTKVTKGLPKDLGTEEAYQQQVNAVKLLLEHGNETPVLVPPDPIVVELLAQGRALEGGIETIPQAHAALRNLMRVLIHMLTLFRETESPAWRVHGYIAARETKEELQAALKRANLLVTTYTQILATNFEMQGISSVRTDDGTVSINPEPSPVYKDRAAFREWCIENGYAEQMVLLPQKVASILRERMVEGKPIPTGLEAFSRDKISLKRR